LLVFLAISKKNIGFDKRGNVKVFDFGLAKSLHEDRLSHCDYYKLTGNVGSIPYMAPEVALTKPYNEKCDVYSYGILLYEIISLRPPFSPAINTKYKKAVVQGGRRPPIKKKWPSMAKEVMKSSWMTSPLERPNMKTIYSMIKVDLKVLETEENIESHIACMANISRHSSSKYLNLDNLSLEESRHKGSN
jgi:serine/threonine protein kinase